MTTDVLVTAKKLLSLTDEDILNLPNVLSWDRFLEKGCDKDSTIDGCASKSYNDTAVIFWDQFI